MFLMNKKEMILEEYYKDPDNFNRAEYARRTNTDERYIRRVIKKAKKNTVHQNSKPVEEEISFNQTSNKAAFLDIKSITIHTLEKALEVAQVDLTTWQVDRYTITSWQVTLKLKRGTGRYDGKGNEITEYYPETVTMYHTKVWLKLIKNHYWIKALQELKKEMPKINAPIARKLGSPRGDFLLEVALFDVHFGMLAWGKETINDYDIKIAEDIYYKAAMDLVERTRGYPISRIVFPLGNDFLHIDDPTNQTPTNHNLLDVDSRFIKIYKQAKKAVIKAINYCRGVAPVDIVWVPGNHDMNVSYFLCDVMSEVFGDCDDVTVDIGPKWRKFYPWGKSLIVYTHGMEEPMRDLPSIIATEEPVLWSNSIYREIHIGHKHKKHEIRWVNVDTYPGTVVRMIPSLATEDAWHYRKGYIRGWYAAEAYIWDKERGQVGQFTSFADYKK
jgi:hypothetical protein